MRRLLLLFSRDANGDGLAGDVRVILAELHVA